MNNSRPSHMSDELNELIQFSQTLSLSEEETCRFQSIVANIDRRIKFQYNSLRYLKQSFDELCHQIKHLLFDLESTKQERDYLELELTQSKRTDSSN